MSSNLNLMAHNCYKALNYRECMRRFP